MSRRALLLVGIAAAAGMPAAGADQGRYYGQQVPELRQVATSASAGDGTDVAATTAQTAREIGPSDGPSLFAAAKSAYERHPDYFDGAEEPGTTGANSADTFVYNNPAGLRIALDALERIWRELRGDD